jgi:hypothetical protein
MLSKAFVLFYFSHLGGGVVVERVKQGLPQSEPDGAQCHIGGQVALLSVKV